MDEALGRLWEELVVAVEATLERQPSQRSFYHPSPGNDLELPLLLEQVEVVLW